MCIRTPVIYYIDIKNIVSAGPDECTIKIFVGVTLIYSYVTRESNVELERSLNMSLSIVKNCMNRNKLKMNSNKT